MSIELDMALRWFAGGFFCGLVSVYWLRGLLCRLQKSR